MGVRHKLCLGAVCASSLVYGAVALADEQAAAGAADQEPRLHSSPNLCAAREGRWIFQACAREVAFEILCIQFQNPQLLCVPTRFEVLPAQTNGLVDLA